MSKNNAKSNLGYRPNVAAFILNQDNQIFLGERPDIENSWQTVQGGIEEGQTIFEALQREILEEIGLNPSNYEVLACATTSFKYTYPENSGIFFQNNGWLGQEQFFHLIRTSNNPPINLDFYHREFSSWKWGSAEELLNGLVEFKKPPYSDALRAFNLI